jgi:membrane-associated phospholipid phosphatase
VTRLSTAPKASDLHGASARRLSTFTNWLLASYLAMVLLLTLAFRTTPSVDVFFVLVAIGAVLAGRGVAFIRDWAPFVLVFLAWEAMRGVANQFGQSVQSDSVIALERALMFGTMPPEALQAALRTAGQVSTLDVGLSIVYMSHFFFPLALAFWLWWNDRARYYRFVVTLMAVSFAAFFTFLIVPVAPPRFAWVFGSDIVVADVMSEVTTSIGWHGFSWMYGNLVGNPFAAFPSMHAAYPVLAFLFLAERSRVAALAWLPAVALIWFATVYLGHHYVVDLLGGAAYAVVGYLLFRSSAASRLAETYRRAFGRATRDLRGLFRRDSVGA